MRDPKQHKSRYEKLISELAILAWVFAVIGTIFYGATKNMAEASEDRASVKHPVVVELFTSQGCNSCPPAEAFLNKLADRNDVIALEFHVDYWDYIGWKDPFASAAFTQRQRSYAANLEQRYVYTPQMVINGVMHEVGSREMSVEVAIDGQLNRDKAAFPAVKLDLNANNLDVTIEGNGYNAASGYDIVIVSFDASHKTKVTRGENRGRILENSNVVRDMYNLGAWDGSNFSTSIAMDQFTGDGGCVVMLQKKGGGEVLAAAMLELS